jgi:hypothetical protein
VGIQVKQPQSSARCHQKSSDFLGIRWRKGDEYFGGALTNPHMLSCLGIGSVRLDGLLRQYFPEGTDLSAYNAEAIGGDP